MKMKTALSVLAAAVAAVMSSGAMAQDAASAPKSRADVKAETKAAEKSGQTIKAGEAGQAPAAEAKSNKTRAERQATTKEARAKHELTPAGEGSPKQ